MLRASHLFSLFLSFFRALPLSLSFSLFLFLFPVLVHIPRVLCFFLCLVHFTSRLFFSIFNNVRTGVHRTVHPHEYRWNIRIFIRARLLFIRSARPIKRLYRRNKPMSPVDRAGYSEVFRQECDEAFQIYWLRETVWKTETENYFERIRIRIHNVQ